MGKLISHISNYPVSPGAVANSNKLLLNDGYTLRKSSMPDYFRMMYEISRNIRFFDEAEVPSKTWNDLLQKDQVFRLSRFLTIETGKLHTFFVNLPQANHFTSDNALSQDEYEILCYQKIQILQHLFAFYQTISVTIADNNLAVLFKREQVTAIFVRFRSLYGETQPLIKAKNQINAPDFNEIVFSPVDDYLLNSLNSFYNPSNRSDVQLLGSYPTKYEKTKAAAEYLYTVFKGVLQVHQMFMVRAAAKLNELVTVTPDHEPHISLLIAFAKMQMLFDARFNQLIHSHTSFFYRDWLQLQQQAARPDTACVTVELAKNVNQYAVESGTLFKAGKNSQGVPVFYQALQTTILNRATVAGIKSFVRIFRQNKLEGLSASGQASDVQWQVNHAWIPFNDIPKARTGLGLESHILQSVTKKDTEIDFEFTFNNNVPDVSGLSGNMEVSVMLEDDTEENLNVLETSKSSNVLIIKTSVVKNLTKAVRKGINARLKLVAPGKEELNNGNVILFTYLLSEPIGKVQVKMQKQHFSEGNVKTATATFSHSESFIAFGAQSLAGSSFCIAHPFLRFTHLVNLNLTWSEKLKESGSVKIENQTFPLTPGDLTSGFSGIQVTGSNLTVSLVNDLVYTKVAKIKNATIETDLPRILQVKSLEMEADLTEDIYQSENKLPLRFIEYSRPDFTFLKSLALPFTIKKLQKTELRKRYDHLNVWYPIEHRNNLLTHIYPLGDLKINPVSKLTFLPDYSQNGFSEFEADLYIGLQNIRPGESISLLFDMADETAGQSQLEARISWFYLSENKLKEIDPAKITDTTAHFLQTGIVKLSLPEDATSNNTLVEGKDTFWLVARCDRNYEVVANIRTIKPNAIAVVRVLDDQNRETKISVPPGTIENIFPKTANIKGVEQITPSGNGKEAETDISFFRRSSQRLRHKHRAVNQWDFEQLLLENFSYIFNVKCLNHAWFCDEKGIILAKPGHTLIILMPVYRINPANPNFQPAVAVSKLVEIKSWLQGKTSAFNRLQVINPSWEPVRFEIKVMLNEGYLDIPYYQIQLDADLKRFLSPWAFGQDVQIPFPQQKLYLSVIVDFIDELPYVHHIVQLRVFKNEVEQFDEIVPASEAHMLTSAFEHTVKAVEYAD